MRRIFLLSDSLSGLDRSAMTQSSQKYEFDLAAALSKKESVVVISSSIDYPKEITHNNVILLGCRRNNNNYGAVLDIINSYSEESVLIFWGYDLKKVIAMRSLQSKSKTTVVPFVYDTHKTAVSVFPFAKRIIANIYFGLGRFFLRRFSKIILFQETAAKLLKFDKKPFLVLKPGAVDLGINVKNQDNYTFNVTFCGTLTTLNGVDALIDSFEKFVDTNIHFTICGSGPLSSSVEAAADQFDFVDYLGVVDDAKIKEIYSKSNLLLNLRRPDDEAMNYAFPSKLFESIGSGIPVLTTPLLSDECFSKNVYVLNKVSPECIFQTISAACRDREAGQHKAQIIKEYISKNYSFEKAADMITEFLFKENKE